MISMKPASTLFGAALAIFFAYSLGGCPPTPAPKPPVFDASDATTTVVIVEDAAVVIEEPKLDAANSPCARACVKLKELGCPEAQTLDGGKSCVQVCSDSEAKFSLKPLCIAKSGSLQELKLCKTVRCLTKQ